VPQLSNTNTNQEPFPGVFIITILVWHSQFIGFVSLEEIPMAGLPIEFRKRLYVSAELFRGYQQQDAHEFLNYLLNKVAELLASEAQSESACAVPSTSSSQNERKGYVCE
jgi:ubiquitin C-terminal hydrolase